MSILKKMLINKVFLYLSSRYMTYFIQFFTSMIIAERLGPYYLGIWGFILLMLNYFKIIDGGISNSLNILLVQHRDNEQQVRNYVASARFLTVLLCVLIFIVAIYYYFFDIRLITEKYKIGNLFYMVCFIAVLVHFNKLYMVIYRVKNSLFEIAFYQSITPLLVLLIVFFIHEEKLLYFLVSVYLVGEVLPLILYHLRKKIPLGGSINSKDLKGILNKGYYLFVYNVCFYLIITSTKTLIGIYYTVEEFGFFTFSYTLANAVLLLLNAFSFIIFPKIIDKMKSKDNEEIISTIGLLRVNYISLAHGLIYVAILFFPVILYFLPKFQSVLDLLVLVALTVLLYTNSFGYSSFLMARNREKKLAIISFIVLIVNILLSLIMICVLEISFKYIICATLFSYLLFVFLLVWEGKQELKVKPTFRKLFEDSFPMRLFIPYIMMILIVCFGIINYIFVPFIVYLFLNRLEIRDIFKTILKIIKDPTVINLK